MERAKAEAIVRRGLGIEAGVPLPDASLRQVLRGPGGAPRHGDLFALLGRLREALGYGGITVELAEGMESVEDVVRYLEGLPG